MAATGSAKVGFIGFGNMARAIAQGLLRGRAVEARDICACAKSWDKLVANTEFAGMVPMKSAREVCEAADVVFIAVKPRLVAEVCRPVADVLARPGKAVVCVAFGVGSAQLEEVLPGSHHLSAIPNIPVAAGEGMWVCEDAGTLDEGEAALVRSLMESCGRVASVAPSLMLAAGTLASCGPAFAALFMEALADAAVKHGVPRELAYELAGQMVRGSGGLVAEGAMRPSELKDAVCSPGGATIKGVAALERDGLRGAVIDAVDAIGG